MGVILGLVLLLLELLVLASRRRCTVWCAPRRSGAPCGGFG